jgi:hypothetical protein
MNGLDLRPRVIFYTASGAVIVTIDPASMFGGSVILPGLGAVPYDLDVATQRMILHVPGYGDAPINLYGGGGGNTVTLPILGTVLYEVTIGPPDIPIEQQATVTQAYLGAGLGAILPWIIGGAVVWVLWRRR